MTHYDVLGVSFDASLEEVRKAYRKKIFELHPDRNEATPRSEELLRWVQAAYETLSDPEKRAEYDLGLRVPGEGEEPSAHLSYFAAITSFAREQAGLVALLVLSPAARFSFGATFYFLGLFLLSLGIMPLLPASESRQGFERRSMLLVSIYLIFWLVLNPLETGPRDDLLFCLAFGQVVGNVMGLIAQRMRREQGLSIRLMPFTVAIISSLMVVLQFTVFLGKDGDARMVGSDGSDWGILLVLLVVATGISSFLSKEAEADEPGQGNMVIRL